MGAGKSTIGRHLARSLAKGFVDCDRELEERTGAPIPLIFELEGEEGFRRRERDMLETLVARDDVVLATGGGVVLDEVNRANLMRRGYVICLCAPIDLLVSRTARDRGRPLLQTDDRRARFVELMETRDPLYRQVADMIVETNHRSSRRVVKEILKRIAAL